MPRPTPPGWPRDLPPPGTEEFDDAVVSWLLDRAPGEFRGSPIRQLPAALARVVSHVVAGELEGVRRAYAAARVELAEPLSPDQIATVQAGLEAEGARLLGVQRELALVETALRGAQQRPTRGSIA